MNLYIETQDGQAINHPAFESNLVEAFGSIPDHWELFVRVERPSLGVYEVLDSEESVYTKVGDIWTDVWSIRSMTDAEKNAKQQAVKDNWAARNQAENWSAWVFDEATCSMQPPIPRPEPDQNKLDQRIRTFWCGAENNWKDSPVYPDDGNQYKFDFFAWQWVEVTV